MELLGSIICLGLFVGGIFKGIVWYYDRTYPDTFNDKK